MADPGADQTVILENAVPICNKPIPPPPTDLEPDAQGNYPVTIVLFYQYIEPAWTDAEHKKALSYVINLGNKSNVCGRGRCATEGLNCTLSGTPQNVRAFCQGLRDWNPIFNSTDFKFTDNIPYGQRFKALTIRKTDELVAYGLEHDKAPILQVSNAEHVEAHEYHKMMTQPDTVIIDVRNFYESDIGHFQPPPGGAQLLDPKMRNSHEFPKWLNAPETKEKLKGKKVMMYCTGGIRCERASALLDHMEKVEPEFKTQGIAMVRGGIERYLKTFPEGGFWKGKNYLFDRRFEQVPELKSEEALAADVKSVCCWCAAPWAQYRGKFKCADKLCKVPVIVCDACSSSGAVEGKDLYCPLCKEGYDLRHLALPDLKGLRQQTEAKMGVSMKRPGGPASAQERAAKRAKQAAQPPSQRLFVGNLPYTANAASVAAALGLGIELLDWVVDRTTKLFYGSAFLHVDSLDVAKRMVEKAASSAGVKVGGRRLRVNYAPPPATMEWPPPGHVPRERPPLPCT